MRSAVLAFSTRGVGRPALRPGRRRMRDVARRLPPRLDRSSVPRPRNCPEHMTLLAPAAGRFPPSPRTPGSCTWVTRSCTRPSSRTCARASRRQDASTSWTRRRRHTRRPGRTIRSSGQVAGQAAVARSGDARRERGRHARPRGARPRGREARSARSPKRPSRASGSRLPCGRRTRGILQVIHDHAAPCLFFDSDAVIGGLTPDERQRDRIHPNEKGGARWAQSFWAWLQDRSRPHPPRLGARPVRDPRLLSSGPGPAFSACRSSTGRRRATCRPRCPWT